MDSLAYRLSNFAEKQELIVVVKTLGLTGGFIVAPFNQIKCFEDRLVVNELFN